MSLWGTDFLCGVVYKLITYVLVRCVYNFQYFSSLHN